MQRPFKIAKHIDDIERGQVLQDVHSIVGGHISQLPDEILECILNKFELRDAVRAGLVSSRWRHLVLSRPRLHFNLSNMFEVKSSDRTKCICSEYKFQFVWAVCQFVASYRGTRINKFFLRFCMKDEFMLYALNWIRFALDLGVEELDVGFCCQHFKSEVPLSRAPCKIPIELSPSRPLTLKYLRLACCDVGETFTLCPFSRLGALRFQHICMDSHDMESVLSSLVNLKMLEITQCRLPPYLSLNSLTSLETVSVSLSAGLKKIDVASLKLKVLKVLCRKTVSLGLTGVPNLRTLCYAEDDGSMCRIFSKLPELVPRLRTLRVDSSSNWIHHMPESIATFSRLGRLMLALDPKVEDIMFKIVQLLKSCPFLRVLSSVLSAREDKEHKMLESIEYHHEHLKWITICEFVGTEYQIESCKCLLKLAPRAKKLTLKCDLPDLMLRPSSSKTTMYTSHPMSEEERQNVVNTLRAFSNDDVNVFFS